MNAERNDTRSRPEFVALVGLGVTLYGLIYTAALVRDPIWALLGLTFGGFWGAVGGSLSGLATWGVLRLAASRGLGRAATIAVAAICAGVGTALVTLLFLMQPLNWFTISVCAMSSVVIAAASHAVTIRLRRRRAERT